MVWQSKYFIFPCLEECYMLFLNFYKYETEVPRWKCQVVAFHSGDPLLLCVLSACMLCVEPFLHLTSNHTGLKCWTCHITMLFFHALFIRILCMVKTFVLKDSFSIKKLSRGLQLHWSYCAMGGKHDLWSWLLHSKWVRDWSTHQEALSIPGKSRLPCLKFKHLLPLWL